MLEIAGRRNNDILRGVRTFEVIGQPALINRLDAFLRAENRTAERVAFPEGLREDFVHEIVGRILDHLDFFDDDLLFALDVDLVKCRPQDDVRQNVDGKWQVLVEHLDVVAGVLLGGKRVELSADGIHRLRNLFGRAGRRALEQHVLDEMGDSTLFVGLVPGPAREPHAQADRTDMAHRFSHETNPVVECVANNHESDDNRRANRSGHRDAAQWHPFGKERLERELEGS